MQKKILCSVFKRPVSTYVLTEWNSYLQAPNTDSETNPLEWWKAYCTSFPRVSLLAKRYVCIPATLSPSERACSIGSNILTCHREPLKPNALDRLLFLNDVCLIHACAFFTQLPQLINRFKFSNIDQGDFAEVIFTQGFK